jgi:hypothetical protein
MLVMLVYLQGRVTEHIAGFIAVVIVECVKGGKFVYRRVTAVLFLSLMIWKRITNF